MTTEILMSIVGLALSMMGGYTHLLVRFAKMETKVDTLWTFMLRRAEIEAVNKSVAEKNSPIKIKDDALKCIPPTMASELRLYWLNSKMPDKDFMLEIERRFGERLLKEVCVPNRLTEGACLLIALAVAKGDPIILIK